MQVLVRDNNVDQALRVLKKKLQREGVFREMKLRRNYEKPSEKNKRKDREREKERLRAQLSGRTAPLWPEYRDDPVGFISTVAYAKFILRGDIIE